MILADTSVWIAHLREDQPRLRQLLEADEIHSHPFIIGELACGTIKRRDTVLALLAQLPMLPVTTHAEALGFLNAHRLWGRGLGWIDIHLLASTVVAGARFWTLDRRLATVAERLRVGH